MIDTHTRNYIEYTYYTNSVKFQTYFTIYIDGRWTFIILL